MSWCERRPASMDSSTKRLQITRFVSRVSDLGRSPSGAKTEQCKEEGGDACSAREPPDDAAMRRFAALRVSDGTRTRDRLDHNQELYLLSYAHRGSVNLAAGQRRNVMARLAVR